jgi:hypothetical protein
MAFNPKEAFRLLRLHGDSDTVRSKEGMPGAPKPVVWPKAEFRGAACPAPTPAPVPASYVPPVYKPRELTLGEIAEEARRKQERAQREAKREAMMVLQRATLKFVRDEYPDKLSVSMRRSGGHAGPIGARSLNMEFELSEIIHQASWRRDAFTHHVSYQEWVDRATSNWTQEHHDGLVAWLKGEPDRTFDAVAERERLKAEIALQEQAAEHARARIAAIDAERAEQDLEEEIGELAKLEDPRRGVW